MSLFASKYKSFSVGLKRGYSEIINGYKVTHKPVKAKFRNYFFDSKAQAEKLGMTEEEIDKKLRSNKYIGKDFWEKGPAKPTASDLVNTTFRDGLKDKVDEVDDMGVLQRAIKLEEEQENPRKTAINMYKAKALELLGDEGEEDAD